MAITIEPGKTDISLHPQQLRVLLSPANEILYGGAAGPGKSFLVRALFLAKAIMTGEGASGIHDAHGGLEKERIHLGSKAGLGQPIVTKFLKGGDEGSESE